MRLFFLSVVLFYQASTFAQSQFVDQHVTPVYHRLIDRTSLTTLVLGVGAVTLARTQDDYTRDGWIHNQNMDKDTAHMGDLLGTGGFSLLVTGGQYLWDNDKDHWQSHLRGFAYGGLSIYVLKTVFNRKRPGTSQNYQSFPSGHTAIMFMSATHLTYAYGWTGAIIGYPLALLTGASRLTDDAHWLSDTVAGAVLGIVVGRATYYHDSDLPIKNDWAILPVINHDSYQLVFQKDF